MSEPLLAFREVDVFYGVIQALKQVSSRSIRVKPWR
jgi:branched-chain amino acid transport system ATP-binding protein